ncbi:MAG: helix-turn-helix domain-containing protein [Candidatus Woesearchaeota archaeon]
MELQIIEKLQQNFGLDKRQALILKVLISNKEMSAKDLSKTTGITMGRLYEQLSILEEVKIIERIGRRPFKFRTINLDEKVIDFTQSKIRKMLKSQADILEIVNETKSTVFDRINDSKKFTYEHLNMISESKKTIKYISLHTSFPFLMYPMDINKFEQLRKIIVNKRMTITFYDHYITRMIFNTYYDALKEGKSFEVIFELSSLISHMEIIASQGEFFFKNWKKMVLDQIKLYNLKIYVIDEYTPFQIDINEYKVNISFRHEKIINGIIIRGREITELYSKVFEQHKLRAKNILPILQNANYKDFTSNAKIL